MADPVINNDLLEHFRTCLNLQSSGTISSDGLTQRERIDRVFQGVIHSWTSPDRHYHTLTNHLVPLLQTIKRKGVIVRMLMAPRIFQNRSDLWDDAELRARDNLGRDLAAMVG